MKSHEFEMYGGRIISISSGKSKWPDSVSMEIPTWYAWNIIQNLISQLKDGDKVCHFAVCGKLKVDVPDEIKDEPIFARRKRK